MDVYRTDRRGIRVWLRVGGLLVTRLMVVAASASGQPRPEVTLRVTNLAKISDQVLLRAEKETDYILAKAGVRANLVNCVQGNVDLAGDDPCQRPRGPNEFSLWIVYSKAPRVSQDVLGYARLEPEGEAGGGVAWVYYPMAENFATAWNKDVSRILGAAMAHEIGHLLLGLNAHWRSGVMSARFGTKQLEQASTGSLLFAPEQAQQLRAVLKSRSDKARTGEPAH